MVPGGVVCFFPSYDYEKRVYSRWTETNLLDKIGKKKKVCIVGMGNRENHDDLASNNFIFIIFQAVNNQKLQ